MKRILTVCVALCMTAVSAAAQIAREAGPFYFPLTRAESSRVAELLKLDKEQASAASSLFQAYRSGMRDAGANSQKAMEALEKESKEGWKPEYARRRMTILAGYLKEVDRKEKEYFEDLKVLLSAEQLERFPRVERARRRMQISRFPLVSGEGVDLREIARKLKIEGPEVEAVLSEWEEEVGRQDVARLGSFRALFATLSEIEDRDPSSVDKHAEPVMRAALQARDTNRRFARRIGETLSEDAKAKLEQEVKAASYPKVYARSAVAETLASARKLQLSADQKANLDAIESAYASDASRANDRWAAAISAKQDEMQTGPMKIAIMLSQPAENDPLTEAAKARETLDNATIKRIVEALTADQRKEFKAAPVSIPDGRRTVMPDFDDREGEYERWSKEN